MIDPIKTFLVVERDRFVLKLYERPEDEVRFERIQVYEVAIGQRGYETPRGLYLISSKVKDPDWKVPDSPWAIEAGLVPGTVIKGGDPRNPLVSRWIGITEPSEGVGIHGTDYEDSIGSAASHGCVRMYPDDVEELYPRVGINDPIYVV